MSRPPQLRPPGHPPRTYASPRAASRRWRPRTWAVAGALVLGLPVVTAISWAQEATAPAPSTPVAISLVPEQVVTARDIVPFGVSREGSVATVWAVGKTRAPSAEPPGPPRPSTPPAPTTPTRPGSAGSGSTAGVDTGEREGRRASVVPLLAGRGFAPLAPPAPRRAAPRSTKPSANAAAAATKLFGRSAGSGIARPSGETAATLARRRVSG
ncbi:MAG: hypothetical protein Q7T55_15615, partial [Solirubrobacteraceae bacterium]|nr:hypothetical protein [Solirubrobacteraceae bacterium]